LVEPSKLFIAFGFVGVGCLDPRLGVGLLPLRDRPLELDPAQKCIASRDLELAVFPQTLRVMLADIDHLDLIGQLLGRPIRFFGLAQRLERVELGRFGLDAAARSDEHHDKNRAPHLAFISMAFFLTIASSMAFWVAFTLSRASRAAFSWASASALSFETV